MKYLSLLLLISILVISTGSGFSQGLPIHPARTVTFTTDEGTDMNIDISPDGKTIMFDLLGDLYSIPAIGGTAKQITRGLALHVRPKLSPDGTKIACISDYSGSLHLNILDINGNHQATLGEELDPAERYTWTQDSRYIAINSNFFGVAGGKISIPSDKWSKPLRFSKDGSEVFYMHSDRLFVFNRRDNKNKPLSLEIRGAENIVLSSDNRWMVFMADSNERKCLMAYNLGDSSKKMLVPFLFEKGRFSKADLNYAISPDGRYVFVGYGGKIHRVSITDGIDQIIPFTVHVQSDLGPLNYNKFYVSNLTLSTSYIRTASPSPDGRSIVFATLNKIYVMDLRNGKSHVLVHQNINQFQPCYSPDGKWIAYITWCDSAGGQVWKVPAIGGKPTQLTTVFGQYQRPTWSPDGKFIAVIKGGPASSNEVKQFAAGDGHALLGDRDDHGIGQLQLIPLDSDQILRLIDSIPLFNQLAFSSDGKQIFYEPAFKFDRNNKTDFTPQLKSYDLGNRQSNVLALGPEITRYQQKMISPDKKFIVYSADEDLYLVHVNLSKEPTILYGTHQKYSVIRFAHGVDPYWLDNGKIVCWTYGNKFYQVSVEKILAAVTPIAQNKVNPESLSEKVVTININPDKEIKLCITVPNYHANGMIALKNVRIITMHGDKVIENGTVVIKDGRFISVGQTASINIPEKAKVVDLAGATIIPGLVDTHLHVRLPSNVFPQQSWMLLANLAYGITTARDPSQSIDSFGYSELLRSGQMIGPRLYSVGRAGRIPDGMLHCDNFEEARRLVHKRTLFNGIAIKQYLLPTRLQRQWLLIASKEARLNMTNEGDRDFVTELGMIKDGSSGVEHSPDWSDVYNDVILFMAATETFFTPTFQIGYGPEAKAYFNYKYWRQPNNKLSQFIYSDSTGEATSNGAESLEVITKAYPRDTTGSDFLRTSKVWARILHAGGLVALGSHGNDEGIGAHNELWALQMGGLTNMEALQAATINGSRALGLQKDIGSIEVGKIADLVILNKNPLDDIHNSREIRYVMKDGILYNGNNLETIWPIKRKAPEWKIKDN